MTFFRFFPAFFPLARRRGEFGDAQGLGQVGDEVLEQFRVQVGKVGRGGGLQSLLLIRGRLGAGGEEVVGQGLPGAGEKFEIGGQQAALVGRLGRIQQTVDGVQVEVKIQFVHKFDDGGALANGLEDLAGIAFGTGSLSDRHDQLQKRIEDNEIAFPQDILETVFGVRHFFQQVLLVAMQSRLAEVVLPAQLGQGGGPVQQGQVDGLALGMVADGA